MTERRLIEEAFPLKKVSEDSKHEKNVRHGHISTLHIWPARRPLAACRAAIIAALLPDPGTEAGRAELCKKIESITHWGTENGPALDFFRQEIRKAYGGRAPRVLDPFAGGGAIPLEAMRLGCDVVANDYNPVAWFILKCTLEFPQKLAGKTWPLPILDCRLPIADSRAQIEMPLGTRQGDLADHVRYWGQWVLEKARAELAPYYPTVDGRQPPPDLRLKAQDQARAAARKRVEKMQVHCPCRRTGRPSPPGGGCAASPDARTDPHPALSGPDDLNALFHRQVEREGADGRYRYALRLLGGYPTRSAEEIADADAFVRYARPNELTARITGSEVDAAINDPRWKAKEALHAL
jgi:hypothetical protein